ncbi:MAG: PilZ domain-containing protein [Firmicutes bacterium]|nr:PilZ domain-containing protein [Bacillota bacterium]
MGEGPKHCTFPGCSIAAVSTLEQRPYCAQHLFEVCYQKVDEYLQGLRDHTLQESDDRTLRNFLTESTSVLTDLATSAVALDNLARARLLDLLLRVSELGQHLRRSPRRSLRVPVRLAFADPGARWEEVTETQVISRYGARLSCHHRLDAGDLLLVVRLDKPQRAQARVAWCRRVDSEVFEIGIELLSCDNFWEIDWEAPQESLADPSP